MYIRNYTVTVTYLDFYTFACVGKYAMCKLNIFANTLIDNLVLRRT